MTESAFSWYERNSKSLIGKCSSEGTMACAATLAHATVAHRARERDGPKSSTVFLAEAKPGKERSAKRIKAWKELQGLADRMNATFTEEAHRVLQEAKEAFQGVEDEKGRPIDTESIEIRLLVKNQGIHLAYALNRCEPGKEVDIEHVIERGSGRRKREI